MDACTEGDQACAGGIEGGIDARAGRKGESGVEHAQDLGGDAVWDAWASDPSKETFDFSVEMVLCAATCRA